MNSQTENISIPEFLEPLRAGFSIEGEGKLPAGEREIEKSPHGTVTLPPGGIECKFTWGACRPGYKPDFSTTMSLRVYLVLDCGQNIQAYVMSGLPYVLLVTAPLLSDALAGVAGEETPPGLHPADLSNFGCLEPAQPGLFD